MKGNFKDAVKILWNGSQHKKKRGKEHARVEKAEQLGKGTNKLCFFIKAW